MHYRGYATVVVGQCSLLREGVAHILRATESKFRVVAAAPTVYDPLLQSLERHQLLVLIVDSGSTARAMMAEQIDAFRQRHAARRVAVISDNYDLPLMVSAFRAGADAYFSNIVASDAFIKALELIMLGETMVPCEVLCGVPDRAYQIEDPRDVHRVERRLDEEILQPFVAGRLYASALSRRRSKQDHSA